MPNEPSKRQLAAAERAAAAADDFSAIGARRCSAKSKRTGLRCGGTAVTGMNVCFMHGGASTKRQLEGVRQVIRPIARRAAQALYQAALPADVRRTLEDLEADPNRAQLDAEVDLLRAHLAGVLRRPLDDEFTYRAQLDAVLKLTEAIGAACSRNVKIRETFRLSITPDVVERFVNRVMRAVEIACGPHKVREVMELLAGRHPRSAELGPNAAPGDVTLDPESVGLPSRPPAPPPAAPPPPA